MFCFNLYIFALCFGTIIDLQCCFVVQGSKEPIFNELMKDNGLEVMQPPNYSEAELDALGM